MTERNFQDPHDVLTNMAATANPGVTQTLRVLISAVIVAAAIPLALRLSPAFACSCAAPGSTAVALAQSAAVFRGTVEEIDRSQTFNISVRFDVTESWKGVQPGRVDLLTAQGEGGCGFDFREGGEYLVFAYVANGLLETSLCSRTVAVSDASDDLLALGDGKTSRRPGTPGLQTNAPEPFPTRLAIMALAGAVLVLAIGGTIVVVRVDRSPPGDD
ncbi:MAG TPA: hypothetical protein QGF35_00315 [Dehalococcoidia bacterium]|nr:hypothetical protein [Dehalococcoidia bacterium]